MLRDLLPSRLPRSGSLPTGMLPAGLPRSGSWLTGALLPVLLLAGCRAMPYIERGHLPAQLSVVVEQADGTSLSLLLDLHRNLRDQLDLRMSQGKRIYDGTHLWTVSEGDDWTVVSEDVSGTSRRLPGGRLQAIDRGRVWIDTGIGADVCSLRDGTCSRTGGVEPLPMTHPGPGAGFALWLEAGTLWLSLPLDGDAEGQALVGGVERVVGVHWVRDPSRRSEPVVERIFRGRSTVRARPRAVEVDGDLGEWEEAAPLVVDAPWQLERGGASWRGEQDASFSVAVAVDERGTGGPALCLAGRVRDDDFRAGDLVTVTAGTTTLEMPLVGAEGTWFRVVEEHFGRRFEGCFPGEAGAELPFAVWYQDVDGDGESVLASAPVEDGVALGRVLFGG